jgi:Arc/MetJ-type ribon-helix-helix transcriptional regulator
MPSNLPRLNVVMPQYMRDWIEAQRLPGESASQAVRRLIAQAMKAAAE